MSSISLNLETYGISDIGHVRRVNEDVWSEMPENYFFILADGMGGHQAGKVAARLTVMCMCKAIEDEPLPQSAEEVQSSLYTSILKANQIVYSMGIENKKMEGMGTTLCCLRFFGKTLIYAHVGDSRVYRFRNQRLEQLTQDHSLRHEMIRKGKLTEQTALTFRYRNVITRAIGTKPTVQPEIGSATLEEGDLYFLCTDGLTDLVSDQEISHVLQTKGSIKEASDYLIDLAKQKGGNDNITVVMIKVS